MSHDAIATCPICSGELAVTRLHCRACGTTLEGDFNVGRFARLSREQFALLESFLRSRGNLKEMERELGISYPTVRGPRGRPSPGPRASVTTSRWRMSSTRGPSLPPMGPAPPSTRPQPVAPSSSASPGGRSTRRPPQPSCALSGG